MQIKSVLGIVLGTSALAHAAVLPMRITEWMYNGAATNGVGEFVEFTNMGASAIDMTGWSFDDDSEVAGSQNLSAFGTVQPGESVVLTDQTAATFRTNWSLAASVKIIGGNANNLSRADEINLYDSTSTLVDRLKYDDQTLGGPRTTLIGGGPNSDSVLGTNTVTQWALLTVGGDPHGVGVKTSVLNEKGNPGAYLPEPSSLALGGFAAGLLMKRARRQSLARR